MPLLFQWGHKNFHANFKMDEVYNGIHFNHVILLGWLDFKLNFPITM